jgi:hypothetical protein
MLIELLTESGGSLNPPVLFDSVSECVGEACQWVGPQDALLYIKSFYDDFGDTFLIYELMDDWSFRPVPKEIVYAHTDHYYAEHLARRSDDDIEPDINLN